MENPFLDLIERLDAGQSAAATELFDRYAARLAAIARNRLDARLRQKLDPDDVVQSVFKSFFRRQGREGFTLDDWNGLWGLLVKMTVRKCSRRAEEFRAAKRNLAREKNTAGSGEESVARWDPIDNEPTPEEAAMLEETVAEVMRELDPRGRRVFELSLQGYTVAEISTELGRTDRLVYRKLANIRAALEALAARD